MSNGQGTGQQRPFVLGLTGGIGSGKTAASECFAALGIPVIDADVISREVVVPGSPALQAIAEHFGPAIMLPDGGLDRRALREQIFQHPTEKAWLEALLHPLIREETIRQLTAAASTSPPPPYVILSSPLLLETGQDALVDRVLLIDVPESLQIARTSARDQNSPEAVQKIMATQMDRTQRQQRADDIIVNDGDLQHLEDQVKKLHHRYLSTG